MKILVTGAQGFIGKNLCAHLINIMNKKEATQPELTIEEVFQWHRQTTPQERQRYCQEADFVFHFAGVNRPKDEADYLAENCGSLSQLLAGLMQANNACPIIFASSIQAIQAPEKELSSYGQAKLACEQLLLTHSEKMQVPVYIYRLPNVFGKWCRPNYNSVVATFCYQLARDLPVWVNEGSKRLELLYIDDLIEQLLFNLQGKFQFCTYVKGKLVPGNQGPFLYVPHTYPITVEELLAKITTLQQQPFTQVIPEQSQNAFMKKLYATYVSYLPKEKIKYALTSHQDARGHFTELFKFASGGQVSVNVTKPKITKGKHWHHTKWEFFVVLSGKALIEERKVDEEEIISFEVSGENLEVVHMLPGYVHQITNLSETEDLITLMWANEIFDQQKPDTFFEEL